MPVASEAEAVKAVQGKTDFIILVPLKYKADFLKTPLNQQVKEAYQVENVIVFKPKAQ